MKMKLFSVTGLCLMVGLAAEAHLLAPVNLVVGAENDATIAAAAGANLGMTVDTLLRLNNLAAAPSGSPFTVSYNSTGFATISWDLSGTGLALYGVYVMGGNVNNFYPVSSDELIASGGDQFINTPTKNGNNPGISHILFLGGRAPDRSVPDGGMTVTLLGSAIAGLGMMARRMKR